MTRYDPVSDYLMHYGRKGMKWHKHIFGDKESESRFNKEGFANTIRNYGSSSGRAYSNVSVGLGGMRGSQRALRKTRKLVSRNVVFQIKRHISKRADRIPPATARAMRTVGAASKLSVLAIVNVKNR